MSADEMLDLVMAYGAAEYAHGVANTAGHSVDERITARRELCRTRDELHQAIRNAFSIALRDGLIEPELSECERVGHHVCGPQSSAGTRSAP